MSTTLFPGQTAITCLHGDDRKGFSLLYDQYYLAIYYFIKKFVTDPRQAEDITADTFVKLWQHAQLTPVYNIKSFLHITAKNLCLDFLKTLQNHQKKEAEIRYLAEQDYRAFHTAEIKAEVLEYIHSEIEKLPVTTREIFKLSFIEGMKTSEIATLLKYSEQTVYNQRAIAIRHLRFATKSRETVMVLLSVWYWCGQYLSVFSIL